MCLLKQNRPQRAQSIMPCTVAMINKAEQAEDKFTIDGIELNQVNSDKLIL
jgi:hypothetical protein